MPIIEEHRVSNPVQFILAGNATFTLRSVRTGLRFTFKVTHKDATDNYPDTWFVNYLFGPDNEGDYAYLGLIRNGAFSFATTVRDRYTGQRKSTGFTKDTPVVKAFDWTFSRLYAGLGTPNLEVWHEGRCGRCGRKLTVPESIELGIGPECANKMAA